MKGDDGQDRALTRPPLSGCAISSRSWSNFGDTVRGNPDSHVISTGEVTLEHPRAQGRKAEKPAASGGPSAVGRKGVKVCKTCGKKGDQWTSECTCKGLALRTKAFLDRPPATDGLAAPDGSVKGPYVPPFATRAADRGVSNGMSRRNDETSVRVTNLSKETRELDLFDLFCSFGIVSLVHVALDEKTGSGKGFGFVKFLQRQEAEHAIRMLDRYCYDDLTIGVEWANC